VKVKAVAAVTLYMNADLIAAADGPMRGRGGVS
jgi:hypothetical protein